MSQYKQPPGTSAKESLLAEPEPEPEPAMQDFHHNTQLYSQSPNQGAHDTNAFGVEDAQVPYLPPQLVGGERAQFHGSFNTHNSLVLEAPETAPKVLPFPSELIGTVPTTHWQHINPPGPDQAYIPDEELIREASGNSVYDQESVLGESGRLYHGYKQGKYYLPNDAAEQDRLDIMHFSFRLLLEDRLALAPFSKTPGYVLDVGTGTGIWAIQFAEENPDAYVIGTDLSAIQPSPSVPNCSFQKDDVEDEWVFPVPGNKFDYVHLRFMVSCFDHPEKVMANAFNHLRPGGWVEYQDSVMPTLDFYGGAEGSATQRLNEYAELAAAAVGRDFKKGTRYKEWLLETGFVDVVEKKFEWPVTPWHADERLKSAGQYMLRSLQDGLRGMSWAFLSAVGLSPLEIENLISDVKRELLDSRYAWYINVYVVYGRKPLEGEV